MDQIAILLNRLPPGTPREAATKPLTPEDHLWRSFVKRVEDIMIDEACDGFGAVRRVMQARKFRKYSAEATIDELRRRGLWLCLPPGDDSVLQTTKAQGHTLSRVTKMAGRGLVDLSLTTWVLC